MATSADEADETHGWRDLADELGRPIDPDPCCPFCVALAALPWPDEKTPLNLCATQLRLSRILHCRGWNAGPAHQLAAGRARARQFIREFQSAAGHAAFAAFSARWRVSEGLPPLSAEALNFVAWCGGALNQ
jgi:hypothetical protein